VGRAIHQQSIEGLPGQMQLKPAHHTDEIRDRRVSRHLPDLNMTKTKSERYPPIPNHLLDKDHKVSPVEDFVLLRQF